jgi:hypothetical protein
VHEHDGLYLRFGLGPTYAALLATTSENDDLEITVDGAGVGLEFLIGGTPLPGLVLGGGLFLFTIPDPKMELNGTESDAEDISLGATMFALMASYYIDPKLGAYAQALVGLSSLSLEYERQGSKRQTDDTDGYALGLGLGWDFWVGNQWSLGPELRVVYARMTREAGDVEEQYRLWAPSLLFTATVH